MACEAANLQLYVGLCKTPDSANFVADVLIMNRLTALAPCPKSRRPAQALKPRGRPHTSNPLRMIRSRRFRSHQGARSRRPGENRPIPPFPAPPAGMAHRKGTCMASTANAFTVGDYVVYPKHGVGRVIELQSEGKSPECSSNSYVLRFEKERMTLRVAVNKVESIGMRKLSSEQDAESRRWKP